MGLLNTANFLEELQKKITRRNEIMVYVTDGQLRVRATTWIKNKLHAYERSYLLHDLRLTKTDEFLVQEFADYTNLSFDIAERNENGKQS